MAFVLRGLKSIFLVLPALFASGPLEAGAFLLPEGQGQFIAGVGYAQGSRRFDQTGTPVPTVPYRKAEAAGYLEYGVTSLFNIVAAPTLSHANGSGATNNVTGSDSSAIGGRVQVFGTATTALAFQVLVQPPIGNESTETALTDGGARRLAVDFRGLVGWSFSVWGRPAFVDVEAGARLRADPFPTEARLDLTFGLRPIPPLMILMQDFSAFAPSAGPMIARAAASKLQMSLVYDLSATWSVQAGGFRTIAGRDVIREMGPFGTLWYRF